MLVTAMLGCNMGGGQTLYLNAWYLGTVGEANGDGGGDDLVRCDNGFAGPSGPSGSTPMPHTRARHCGTHFYGVRPPNHLSFYRRAKWPI